MRGNLQKVFRRNKISWLLSNLVFFKGFITQSKSTKPQAEFNINSSKVLVFRNGQIFKKPFLFWSQSSHYFHSALASFLLISLFLLFIYTFICFSWKNRNHLALTIRNVRECIVLEHAMLHLSLLVVGAPSELSLESQPNLSVLVPESIYSTK